MEYNELEIIRQLQNPEKQRQAFAKVVARYSEKLYWQIRKMVISHDDTDDVLQNTFMKAWVNIESFRGESKLSTWLYRIAINESITFLNKQNSHGTVEMDDTESYLANKLESDDWFDGDELQMKLQKAILRLPEKQRLVFNMRYFDEMKYEEMSDILGTSVGALKASYHHAAKKIEDFMTKDI
ncbi:MAG: sigma-70 family RNA polymerase sigma factor [Bacteroidota bacterium]|nr:sigma-70 family RNA polymerase sigma factor [Bacteroidota bacterium]